MNNKTSIVYVEDDPSSILVMKMIVEKVMGLKTLIIYSNSDGFTEKILNLGFIPDIFLLDIQIKPFNGFELLKMLRATSQFDLSKIIALTASVMNEEVDRLKQNGFDGAIAKPLNISIFPSLIERVLRGEHVWYIS